jgi:hypothetical protein
MLLKNPYIVLLLITAVLTILSFFFEIHKKRRHKLNNIGKLPPSSKIGLFITRYLHYLFLLYFAIFILIFKERGTNAIIYVILAIILSYSWVFFDCCILSYHELLFYGVDHHKYQTNFHPCLYAVFKDNQAIPLYLSGGMMFFTVLYLLVRNKTVPAPYRIIAGGVFLGLFINNIITTRYYDTKLWYPKDKAHKLYRYFTDSSMPRQ